MTERHAHPQPMTNSHILVNDFDYYEPTTLEDAVALLERIGAEAKVLAGGTHLLVQLKMEREKPEALVNITKIPGMDEVAVDPKDGSVAIGACATVHELRSHPVIRECYPALADACGTFGGTQIEIAATLGGNVCNGSPASDTVPALLVYEAELELVGPQGARRLPLEKFLLGPGKTDRRPSEIVKSIHLPASQPNSNGIFIKIARVAADLAKASLAVSVVRKGDTIVACRAAMGSVAPTVVRLRQAEAALAGQTFSPELLAQAGSLAAQEISPIDDTRSSAWYRRQIANVMLQDGLTAAWQRPTPAPAPAAKSNGRTLPVTPALLRNGKQEIELTVNGKTVRLMVRPNDLLLNVLRDQLNLTGAKYGCGIGECGACTVLLDGQAQMGCLVLAVAANGHEITTIEGLQGKDGALDPLQQQFIDDAAFQCGFCTPGFLMATKSLLKEIPHPSEAEVRDYLKGNRCRCTGYVSIVRAVINYTNKNA